MGGANQMSAPDGSDCRDRPIERVQVLLISADTHPALLEIASIAIWTEGTIDRDAVALLAQPCTERIKGSLQAPDARKEMAYEDKHDADIQDREHLRRASTAAGENEHSDASRCDMVFLHGESL